MCPKYNLSIAEQDSSDTGEHDLFLAGPSRCLSISPFMISAARLFPNCAFADQSPGAVVLDVYYTPSVLWHLKSHEDVAKIQLEINAQCRHPRFFPLIYKTVKALALELVFLSLHVQASTESEHYSVFLASTNYVHLKCSDLIFTSLKTQVTQESEPFPRASDDLNKYERVSCNALS
jgi:hypothetical protein